jgi:hypothetical protein
MHEDSRSNIDGINFWKKNVMNISEATRQNKLAEILDSFANKESTSVYIIQNSKKKDAAGVISSVGYHLLREKAIKELEDETLRLSEEILSLKARLRADEPMASFDSALERLQLDEEDLKDIFDNADEVEID